MESLNFPKQLFEFQKSAMNNSMQAMAAFRSPLLSMSEIMFDAGKKFPVENKKIMEEWMLAFKNSQDEISKTIEDGYGMIETFLSTPVKKGS